MRELQYCMTDPFCSKNSILASPTRGIGNECIFFTPVSGGHNIFGDSTCGQNVAGGDMIVPALQLGPLTNNGGPTPTHALPGGSPAIDAIPIADCKTINVQLITTDQRGALRPAGSGCDIGAFEFNGNLDGLVSYWPADDHINDVVGPNNGTFQNGAAYAPGIIGRAFSLNGVSQYIVAADSPSLSLTGSFTLEAWIKIASNNRQQAIIEKYDVPALNGYLLRITDGGKLQSTVCSTWCSQPPATGATTVSINTWHHVVGVNDGTSIKVYLDGVLDGTSATTYVPTDGASSLKIGARGDDANTRLGGLIDEVRIYARALTASEIAEAASLDSTPPEIAPTVTGTLGNNGWYTGDVEVSWSVSDGESSVSSSTGCDAESVTTDTSEMTFTCSATSAGGSSTQSVTVKRDATAPAISCGVADGLWHASDVSIACTSTDGTSGLSASSDASFNLSTSVAIGTETANSSTDSRPVCDNAGNCATAGPIGGNKIDKKAPEITIASPAAGNFLLNLAVAVSYSCSDGGSGVANCSGTTANGGSLDTASPGAKTFTVASADNVGNIATPATVSYSVNFGVVALYDQTRAHKSGSTIPIKIRLVDANGVNVSSPSLLPHAISVIQTSSQASTEFGDAGNSNPDFDFRYDASLGGYIFNLQTTGFGTGSYVLNFIAASPQPVYSVGFQVRQ